MQRIVPGRSSHQVTSARSLYLLTYLLTVTDWLYRCIYVPADCRTSLARTAIEMRPGWMTSWMTSPTQLRRCDPESSLPLSTLTHVTHTQHRLRNDLYCVEWDVKLYYILYHTQWHSTRNLYSSYSTICPVCANDFVKRVELFTSQ